MVIPSHHTCAGASDLHWGDGTARDIANYDGAESILAAVISSRVKDFFIVGDWHDFWRCGRKNVLRHNADRLERWADTLRRAGVHVYYVPGNHDQGRNLAKALAEFGFDSGVLTVAYPSIVFGRWEMRHGNDRDAWNSADSPLQPVGHGLTRVVGLVQKHLWPGLEDSTINPLSLISPARKDDEVAHFLHHAMNQEAAQQGKFILFGHTHRPGFARGEDWLVLNCGCVTRGRASFVTFNESGDAAVHRLEGAFV